ncbi:MAG: ATP-binding protein [Verrucomicrobiota bacterium]
MKISLLVVQIAYERDVVLSRQRARQIAALLGFEQQDQVRIATTISELARNIFQYAKKGKIEFFCDDTTSELQVILSDHGHGIPHLKKILEGDYISSTGMGVGLSGAKRLMDTFHIETSPEQGTVITVSKTPLHPASLTKKQITALVTKLTQNHADDPFQEIQRQNQELLTTMEELQQRQIELDQLNHELEDTNRGVVALYAELDEKADYLRRASEIKSRFLSNMTHEFRTPLNSILALSRMLLERLDGELTFDQEKQVTFIRRAATDLSELVNDLLDLSKVEAGKITIRPTEFEIKDLFGALRGMLRPLLSHNSSIQLVFENVDNIPPIFTDESKLSQILRNFISNAIKYTEKGEVRISASYREDKTIVISVKDTGIGIAADDLARIFEEFTQIDGPHQKKVKGTGLGLSLSKKLAEVLGGNVSVESTLHQGSTFSVTLPLVYHHESEPFAASKDLKPIDPNRLPVLILDDNMETLFIYENYLKGSRFQPIPVRTIKQARAILQTLNPSAIILDILLGQENSWGFLSELKQEKNTRNIPIFVITMVENEAKALKSGATAFHLKPIEKDWLLKQLHLIKLPPSSKKFLLIDDDEVSRYIFRGLLSNLSVELFEAAGGHDGIQSAIEKKPDVIFVDIDMPDLNGYDVIEKLQKEELTKNIPIVFYTANIPLPEFVTKFPSIRGTLSKDLSSGETAQAQLLDLVSQIETRNTIV